MGFGDMFSAGRIRIDGQLQDVLEILFRHLHNAREDRPGLVNRLWEARPEDGASQRAARKNIHHHYDLGNDFYELWLDREAMQYTCAYFEEPELTLEQAQRAKMEHVCRKLQLEPGQHVIEAGCGWGGLARYMAREYDVTVRSYNISREQLDYARRKAKEEGLDDRVEYVEDDYRNIDGRCDRFVSVGMLEHVGPANYAALAKVIERCLDSRGRGLIHTIGRNRPFGMNAWIEKRIFPGAYPPAIGELMNLFQQAGLSVQDAENLRLHYARTLDHWLERFDHHSEEVRQAHDEDFVRAWRLYLAGSAASFRVGTLQLFQVTFAPEENNELPWNRRYLYQQPATEPGGAG
jgi:cyclopropane-fatty-acyl-phospholipid synthase